MLPLVDEGPETSTVDEAARTLKLTPGRVRQMLRAGELEGVTVEESGGRGWKIPMHAVHDRTPFGRGTGRSCISATLDDAKPPDT
jgi:excisionase family DNA binding protein